MEKILEKLYLDPVSPTYLSGVNALYKAAKKELPEIKQKDVEIFLSKQDVYTVHKPYIKYKPLKVVSVGLDADWQVDLSDMQLLKRYNKGYGYILTCIDVLSKFGWAIPIRTKETANVLEGFKKILATGRKPWRIFHDRGKEFVNKTFQKFLEDNFIQSIVMENPISKAPNVERYNRTLKTRLYKYFTLNKSRFWLNILPKIVTAINHSISTTHGMRPVDVTYKNAQKVYERLYKTIKRRKKLKYKFKIGDLVRIFRERAKFEKGYLPTRTEEIFIVAKRLNRQPVVYKLRDLQGEDLTGIFYETELAKVTK